MRQKDVRHRVSADNYAHWPLAGDSALVTGAARGIGRAIAEALSGSGCRVAIADVNGSGVEEVAQEIGGIGIQMDVTSEQACDAAVASVVEKFGHLDFLVNNAGITWAPGAERVPFHELPTSAWRAILGTNLDGVFYCSRAAAREMLPRGSGRIVNIASIVARTGGTTGRNTPYTTSKTAVVGFTRALGMELGPHGVRVNAVAPGVINTEMMKQWATPEDYQTWEERTPLRRLGLPDDIARAVVFLCSDLADFMNGAIIDVNGGLIGA